MLYQLLILVSALGGFLIARHIYIHKSKKKVLVCPLKASCEPVIHSKYSVFLGLDLTIWGMFYYAFVFLGYVLYLFFNLNIDLFKFVLFFLSLYAFLFSLYLTFIQIGKLRKFCSWCLLSAFLSSVIFFSSFVIYRESLTILAQEFKDFSIFIHALSAGIGLGMVIVVDYLFFKFLKDKEIDKREKEIMEYLSDLIWFLIGIIFVSGFFIYFSDMEKYHNSTKFMVKMFIFLVIALNGLILNTFISPKLSEIDFEKHNKYSLMAVSMGIISFISWFLAFLLGRLKSIPFTFIEGIVIYFSLLLISILIGNVIFKSKLVIKK